MAIHHAQIKKAERQGFVLSEEGEGIVAHWPKHNARIYGVSAVEAIAQMEALQNIASRCPSFHVLYHPENKRLINVEDHEHKCPIAGYDTPFNIMTRLNEGATFDTDPPGDEQPADVPNGAAQPAPAHPVARAASGIALDGAVAYKEGTASADCPYDSEDEEQYDDFVRWNEEWDAAADEATDSEESKGGSVVKEKYRAKYAELGHPTHCGDWLAELLNNLCITEKSGTDLDRFEAICAVNGVDTSGYKRSGVGWQGRIRMTGRNLLAKRVFQAGGVLVVPLIEPSDGEAEVETYKAPEEWMVLQRFKRTKSAAPANNNVQEPVQ